MANPTIVASGKFKTTGAASSLSCPIPTIAAGKLIVLLGYSVSSVQFLNTPSGYTSRFGANAAEGYIGCWTKVSTGGDDTATLVTSGGGSYRLQAQYLVIEGYDATTPVNVSALNAASAGSNWNSPSVTPTVNEGLLIGMGGANGASDWLSGDEPDTMTLIDQESTDGSWFGTAYENLSGSSSGVATGTRLWTNAVNSKRTASLVIAPASGSPTPDITAISDDTPYPGQSITLTLTGGEASQGTGSAKINGVSQTITSWSDTSITFTAVLGTNKYGASYNIVVQNNSGNSSSGDTVTMVPPAGYGYVDIGTPNPTAANRFENSIEIASGDQREYETDGSTTAFSDDTFEIAAGVTYPFEFDTRVWTPGDGWGDWGTQTVNDPDIVTPFVDSATVGTNGTTVTVVFSEAVEAGAGGSGGMVVTPLSLSGIALTYASGDGTDTWTFTAASTIYKNRPVNLAYTQPGDGIQDLVGNELGSFSEFVVTNNSTQNQTPTDIALSKNTVSVTGGLNATVGTLSATDADYGETFTFTLVAGTGDTNNADFSISGTTLRCDDPATLGVGTYSVRVQVADGSAATFAKAFSIAVVAAGDERPKVRKLVRSLARSMISKIVH